MNYALLEGDCLEELKLLPDDSLDSLVTDPPAGISFMGQGWDDDKGGRKQWITWMTSVMVETLRVLKPGAHGLVWAIPRTSHWTATALEDAGFEIRDVVTHLFGTGFPKSLDVSKAIDKAAGAEREIIGSMADINPRYSTPRKQAVHGGGISSDSAPPITAPATEAAKQWQGWGTALKPAAEFWILVRKPCSEKTVAANVLKWGTGALNIDASRIGVSDNDPNKRRATGDNGGAESMFGVGNTTRPATLPQGRFPANLVLDEEAATALDEQSGTLKSGARKQAHIANGLNNVYGKGAGGFSGCENSVGGASRFFYVAKASKKDKGAENIHPTVKSTELMSYLCKLITPPEGVILDPFSGSGSTGVGALRNGFRFLGIEKSSEYVTIATKRLQEEHGTANKDSQDPTGTPRAG